MKSLYSKVKDFKENKKGVFGLTSVQSFFTIILGIALLAYVIIVIMGTLNDSDILKGNSLTQVVFNETGHINASGYTLQNTSANGFSAIKIIIARNSSGTIIPATNYSLDTITGIVTNATSLTYADSNFTWSYKYNSKSQDNVENILLNTSEGVSSFFSSINPVYAILAILVIILVLIVLVRVVSGGTGEGQFGRKSSEPQL